MVDDDHLPHWYCCWYYFQTLGNQRHSSVVDVEFVLPPNEHHRIFHRLNHLPNDLQTQNLKTKPNLLLPSDEVCPKPQVPSDNYELSERGLL